MLQAPSCCTTTVFSPSLSRTTSLDRSAAPLPDPQCPCPNLPCRHLIRCTRQDPPLNAKRVFPGTPVPPYRRAGMKRSLPFHYAQVEDFGLTKSVMGRQQTVMRIRGGWRIRCLRRKEKADAYKMTAAREDEI